MNQCIRVATVSVLLLVAACGGKSDSQETPAPSDTATMESMEGTTGSPASTADLSAEQTEFVQRAVTLAKAIQNEPSAAVSILAEKGLTPEQWSAMLEDIARDPALAAAYEAGMR